MSRPVDPTQLRETMMGAMMIVGLRAVVGEHYPFEQAEKDWEMMSEREREHTRQAYRQCYPHSKLG
jgi:hypothetical protein